MVGTDYPKSEQTFLHSTAWKWSVGKVKLKHWTKFTSGAKLREEKG